MFCGDERPFASFLKAGRNLWEPYHLSDFGIFYMTFGMSHQPEPKESTYLSEIFTNLTTISLSNIKVINIRSTFQCDSIDTSKNQITRQFCDKLNKRMPLLIQNQPKSPPESIRFLNEVRFYTVPIFQLFVTMLANMKPFWAAVSAGLNRMNLLKYLKIEERTDIYDVERSRNSMIKRSLVCTFDQTMIDKDYPTFKCPLQYGSEDVPTKEPGECGFEPCVYESYFDWMAILWATIITSIMCTLISIFVFIFFRSKPGDQELPTPMVTGPALIPFSKLTPAADDEGEAEISVISSTCAVLRVTDLDLEIRVILARWDRMVRFI
uniref:Uncharacterized protein n=1 Tax=Romanomermis culicivorax TaxID=13658 RepID=A0A915HYB8_ROMCU